MKTIGIITGGDNSERAISLLSAREVENALQGLSAYTSHMFIVPEQKKELLDALHAGILDFVFVMIHGSGGEDGQRASVLDLYDVPYQCAPRPVLSLTHNKRHTKLVWRSLGLPVADDLLITPGNITEADLLARIHNTIGFPCVRKEVDQGSSVGVHIIRHAAQLKEIHTQYIASFYPVLIEAFLVGDEVTVGILDLHDGTTHPLPIVHIIPPQGKDFDYTNKYNGETQEVCPALLPEAVRDQMHALALQAYHAVGCQKYGRVDAIITADGPVLLEINTIPGFTEQSLYPKAAATGGWTFSGLIDHLIRLVR